MSTLSDEGGIQPDLRHDDWHSHFALRLIEENFLLTALEFHAELVEAGRELPKLKEFFSNPVHFEQQAVNRPEVASDLPRSSSQATLDSLDFARYSEDGERSCDEKVAVLEFELRKAKETISALRANLTYASESENKEPPGPQTNVNRSSQLVHADIKPYEQRALNFLINEYLLRYGYKLTSITFADENESQDFEDWDDVGLNIARHQELLLLYREGLKGSKTPHGQGCDKECQAVMFDEKALLQNLDDLQKEILDIKTEFSILELEKISLAQRLTAKEEEQQTVDVKSQRSVTPDCFEMIEDYKSRGSSDCKSTQSNGDWTKLNVQEKESTESQQESIDETAKEEEDECVLSSNVVICHEQRDSTIVLDEHDIKTHSHIVMPRNIPDTFKNQILKSCDIIFPSGEDILQELLNGTELSDIGVELLIEILSSHLQKIIPNIILNKREEVIPLLVLVISLCRDASTRDQLLAILFNLKKRPQEDERQQILKALLNISTALGPALTESEVLPQCWEQIGHKYVERRLLVAESCFLLTPFVSEPMRHSLILSMVQQLIQDREEIIRHASVNCLALLVTLISVPDKLPQLCDITLDLLLDCTSVSQQTLKILLPAIAQWSSSLHRLQSDLLEKLLLRILREPNGVLLSALEVLLPFLIMFIAASDTVTSHLDENHPKAAKRQDFAGLCKGLYDPLVFFSGSVGSCVSTFDILTTDLEVSSDWPELDWVVSRLLPVVLNIASEHWDNKATVQSLASYLRHLCAGLGKNVTSNLVKPELSRRLEICSAGLLTNEVVNLEMIPLYLVGVLSLDAKIDAGREELEATLFKFICALPLCGAPLLPLSIAIDCLSKIDSLRMIVMDTLWNGVVYNRPVVRSATAFLFQAAIFNIPDHLIGGRVVPALVTLASDPEISVRLAVIPTLGMLANASEKQTRDKVSMTFQSLLHESISSDNQLLLLQILKTLTEFYEKFDFAFRIEVALPQLAAIAATCEHSRNCELTKALTEVFSVITFSQCQLPTHSLTTLVIPSLRALESASKMMDTTQAERVESLLRHAERLIPCTPETPSRPLVTEPNPLSPGVEDVKNRVAKIFSSRPQTFQNVSGIFKKKL